MKSAPSKEENEVHDIHFVYSVLLNISRDFGSLRDNYDNIISMNIYMYI